jgi:hypothetical protein
MTTDAIPVVKDLPDPIAVAPTLEARRARLIAQCADQRLQVREIFSPVAGSALGNLFGGKTKIALAIGAVVLGVLATRPGRAMAVLTTALSMYKMVRSMLPVRPAP